MQCHLDHAWITQIQKWKRTCEPSPRALICQLPGQQNQNKYLDQEARQTCKQIQVLCQQPFLLLVDRPSNRTTMCQGGNDAFSFRQELNQKDLNRSWQVQGGIFQRHIESFVDRKSRDRRKSKAKADPCVPNVVDRPKQVFRSDLLSTCRSLPRPQIIRFSLDSGIKCQSWGWGEKQLCNQRSYMSMQNRANLSLSVKGTARESILRQCENETPVACQIMRELERQAARRFQKQSNVGMSQSWIMQEVIKHPRRPSFVEMCRLKQIKLWLGRGRLFWVGKSCPSLSHMFEMLDLASCANGRATQNRKDRNKSQTTKRMEIILACRRFECRGKEAGISVIWVKAHCVQAVFWQISEWLQSTSREQQNTLLVRARNSRTPLSNANPMPFDRSGSLQMNLCADILSQCGHCKQNRSRCLLYTQSVSWRSDQKVNAPSGHILRGTRTNEFDFLSNFESARTCHFAMFTHLSIKSVVQCQFRNSPKGVADHKECLSTGSFRNLPKVLTDFQIGARLGEAANPGPDKDEAAAFHFVHVNPTAIHGKTDLLLKLNPHVLCCSETSATSYVQKSTSSLFRAQGYVSLWSQPAPPHRESMNPSPEIRGKATGLSLHTCLQARLANPLEHATYYQKARLMRSFVNFGATVIQVVQIYGYPRPATDAKAATNNLLREACCEAFDLNMPTIFVGDFNHDPMSLPAAKVLSDYGYSSTAQIYQDLYHRPQPPTCREATCNDAFVVSPHIRKMVQAVVVDPESDFADHKPIRLLLTMPRDPLTRMVLRRPHSWQDRQPDKNRVAEQYAHLQRDKTSHSFAEWASACEEAVHRAIQEEHCAAPEKQPFPGLARAQRGRYREPKLIKIDLTKPIKPAGPTQYNPNIDQASAVFRQHLAQHRRIQSLYRRMQKLNDRRELQPDWQQLHMEWKAICQARICEEKYESWMRKQPELQEIPAFIPNLDFLFLLMQFSQHHLKQHEEKERRKRIAKQAYQRLYDRKWGSHKRAYALIRPPSNPCLQEVQEIQEIRITIHEGQKTGLLACHLREVVMILPQDQLLLNNEAVTLVHQQEDKIELMLEDADVEHPDDSTLRIVKITQEPSKLGQALHHYWSQYWQRDVSTDTRTEFENMLHETPPLPLLQQQITDDDWQLAIKKLKKTTAKGLCGWGTEELQSLPSQAIRDLRQIFQAYADQGLPASLMQARTIPLGKIPSPQQPSQTRPITILSLLYRAWGKVHCTKILHHWAAHMPPSIVGFIPSRALGTTMMRYQHKLELSHAALMAPQGGLTLDLVKAFNLVARTPAKLAMIHTGIPRQWAVQWHCTITNMKRRWEVAGAITQEYDASTGAPEGDTWSVISMISLSYVWVQQLLMKCSPQFCPIVYADNLGWATTELRDHGQALAITTRWAAALKFQIDWTKTWRWATDETHRDEWQAVLHDVQLPPIQQAKNERELGYMLSYRKTHNRKLFKQRFAEGILQLRKIATLPHDMQTKALLTRAPMTKILHATEIHTIGGNYYKQLRTALTRAMLGPHTQANPYVALITLSQHVQDPELAAALHCFRQIRHLLQAMTDAERTTFLEMVAAHSGQPLQVRGPAGTVKHHVKKLGWTIDARGIISVDGLVFLSLQKSPWEQINDAARQAWLEAVPDLMSTRKEWNRPPLIESS